MEERASFTSSGIMEKTYIFAGPSMHGCKVALPQWMDVKGPCKQSDILRICVEEDCERIVIADGLYKGIPAPWHKEILIAIERGIAVYGVSSLGALRAAEIESFGMKGYGRVYDYFRRDLRDDSDVALLHSGKDQDWKPQTVAYVEIYFWLLDATHRGIITPKEHERLSMEIKQIYFEERTMRRVERCLRGTLSLERIEALRYMYISQKQKDFEGLIQRLKEDGAKELTLRKKDWCLSWTPYIDRQVLKDSCVAKSEAKDDPANTLYGFIAYVLITETRLMKDIYLTVYSSLLVEEAIRISRGEGEEVAMSNNRTSLTSERMDRIDSILTGGGSSFEGVETVKLDAADGDSISIKWNKDWYQILKGDEERCYTEQSDAERYFNNAMSQWLKAMEKAYGSVWLDSEEMKKRSVLEIVRAIYAGKAVDEVSSLGRYRFAEFMTANVIYSQELGLKVVMGIQATRKYLDIVSKWDRLLTERDRIEPHGLYLEKVTTTEMSIAKKRVLAQIEELMGPMKNDMEVSVYLFVPILQLIQIELNLEKRNANC